MSDHNIGILWPFFEDEPIVQAMSESPVAATPNYQMLFNRLLPALLMEDEEEAYGYPALAPSTGRGVKLSSNRLSSPLLGFGLRVR